MNAQCGARTRGRGRVGTAPPAASAPPNTCTAALEQAFFVFAGHSCPAVLLSGTSVLARPPRPRGRGLGPAVILMLVCRAPCEAVGACAQGPPCRKRGGDGTLFPSAREGPGAVPGAVAWSVPAVCAGLVGAGTAATRGATQHSHSVGARSGSIAVTSPRGCGQRPQAPPPRPAPTAGAVPAALCGMSAQRTLSSAYLWVARRLKCRLVPDVMLWPCGSRGLVARGAGGPRGAEHRASSCPPAPLKPFSGHRLRSRPAGHPGRHRSGPASPLAMGDTAFNAAKTPVPRGQIDRFPVPGGKSQPPSWPPGGEWLT